MHSPLVSIIIVNWNGRRFLGNCLGSLSKIKYKNIEVIFVDNASTDGSVEYARKLYPRMKIILNSKNLGYAEGHEEAFKKCKGSLILLLSMDTIVNENFLKELVEVLLSETDIGAVQPKLLMYPNKNSIDSIGSFILPNGMLYHYGREKNHLIAKYNTSMEVFSAKGACVLFRKETLQKTRLFDKDYFAYFEETDLCHRIWLAGYRIIYVPSAVVYHTGGGSSKQMESSFILFHSYKNKICTYIKNLSLGELIKIMPQLIILFECAALVYLFKRKLSISRAIQKAFIWNLVHLNQTLKKRRFVQSKIRIVSDNNFLPRVTRRVRMSYYYHLFRGSLAEYRD